MEEEKKYSPLLWERKSFWETAPASEQQKAFSFSEDYKKFLSQVKTEREAVRWGEKVAQKNGFSLLTDLSKLKAGDKVYWLNKDKNIIFAILGKEPLAKKGFNIIASHIDSPHLDLKVRPLYEEEKLAYLKTHYYGGIKKYHWPTLPLALHGVICTSRGKQKICLGEDEDDPIFMITDLLPHLGHKKQLTKPLGEAISGEELNILVGGVPVKEKKVKEKVKAAILALLNKKYGLKEEDFFSADLQAVPAGKARDVGFDRSLVAAYGHDDRVCAYTSLMALLSLKKPLAKTQICFWVDKEEIGSEGVSSAQALFLEMFIEKLLSLQGGQDSWQGTLAAFSRSVAISSDVTCAYDPDYKEVYEANNTARLGCGLAVEKYTGGGGKYTASEASAELAAKIKEALDKEKVNWQSGGMGKIDEGGGGTIAKYLANRGLETIDCGIPLFNMHAPYEIASKADIYSAYQAYLAFYANL